MNKEEEKENGSSIPRVVVHDDKKNNASGDNGTVKSAQRTVTVERSSSFTASGMFQRMTKGLKGSVAKLSKHEN